MLVARYREMRAGRPLAGLRASAAAVRPLPSPHHSWALPDTPPSHPSRLHPHPLRLPASGAPAVSSDRRAKSENQDRPCRSHPTTVAHRSTKSVGDLAARPQGGVGDVLRALGGGVVLESLVVAGAARRARDEKAAMGRTGKRAPFGTSSIRRAHGRRRRRAKPIASLCNSREPIDARAGSCRRSGSWCI